MTPPIPIFSSNDLKTFFGTYFAATQNKECEIRSLIQYKCDMYNIQSENGKHKVLCTTFKRMFKRCPFVSKSNNKNTIWINIEITDSKTNSSEEKKTITKDLVI